MNFDLIMSKKISPEPVWSPQNQYLIATVRSLLLLAIVGWVNTLSSSAASAQQFDTPLGGLIETAEPGDEEPFKLTAGFKMEPGTRNGELEVCAAIGKPWHIYSITQQDGGPVASTLDVAESNDYKLTGEFTSNVDPHISTSEFFDVPIEEHEGEVKWTAPIEIAEGVDPASVKIDIRYAGQRCLPESQGGMCVPIDDVVVIAAYEGDLHVMVAGEKYQPKNASALLLGKLERKGGEGPLAAGDTVSVDITIEPQGDYFVYAHSDTPIPKPDPDKPTLLVITKSNGWEIGPIQELTEPKPKESSSTLVHKTPATFRIDVEIPADTEPGPYKLGGQIGFQTCNALGCLAPKGVDWEVDVEVGAPLAAIGTAVSFKGDAKYEDVATAVKESNASASADAGEWASYSIATVLPLAFLAGFILNFMPCVLPVIGLKIMSFVHQAGKDPKKVFMLNLVFVLGMLSVFMLLATLAVAFGYGWGDLYQNTAFKVTMIAVIFVFGLSFFDVWEIPIPGMTGSTGLDQKDGWSGQFFKGVITTLLATPCSGPLLIPAVVWAIAQPPTVTYLVFLALGLGMALPYLVIGAFPNLASFLPKPGAWTETFKQLMGFVMIATVIFFLGAVKYKYNMSVLCLLTFLAFACWWVGRISLESPAGTRARGWVMGLLIAAFGVYFSFFLLLPAYELDYKKYSREALDRHLAEGHTVLVDFTADW